jgi:hypothetical protein
LLLQALQEFFHRIFARSEITSSILQLLVPFALAR